MRIRTEELQAHYARQQKEGGFDSACRMLLPPNLEGKRVLDIGCRRGKGLLKIADAVGSGGLVAGLEWRRDFVDEARSYLGGRPIRVHFGYPEDLLAAGIAPASFDVLYANSSLNGFFSPGAALGQFARVLVDGGLLQVDCLFYRQAPSGPKALALSEFTQLLHACGFEELRCEELPEPAPGKKPGKQMRRMGYDSIPCEEGLGLYSVQARKAAAGSTSEAQ